MQTRTASPDPELWDRILREIDGAEKHVVLATLIAGMTIIIMRYEDVSSDEARAKIAAMVVSPDNGTIGSLMTLLETELHRMRALFVPSKGGENVH